MHAVGVDIIEIERIAEAFARFGDRFLRHIYTEGEIAYCRGRAPQLAAAPLSSRTVRTIC